MAQRWQRVTASSSRNLAAPAPALQLVTPPSTLSSPLPLSWFNFHVALGQLCPFVLFKRVRVFPSLRRRPTPRERERERDFPTWVHRGLSATSGAPPYLSTIGSGSFSAPHCIPSLQVHFDITPLDCVASRSSYHRSTNVLSGCNFLPRGVCASSYSNTNHRSLKPLPYALQHLDPVVAGVQPEGIEESYRCEI